MEKKELEKCMDGKCLGEMNRHELAVAGSNAIERVKAAQEDLDAAFASLPQTAKMAAGEQLTAAFEALAALTELSLVTRAELGLVIASTGH